MNVRYVVALSYLAIALPLAAASAQSTPEPPKWSFSLGVDPTNLDLHTPTPGVDARMVANLTRSWQSPNNRFGRYVSLMAGADAPRETGSTFNQQCNCSPTRFSRSYAALTAGAFYDLFRVSRFTPYLSGGTGVYNTTYGMEPAAGWMTPAEAIAYRNGSSRSVLSVGVNGGLGIKARIGSHELFIEQVLHAFDVGHLGRGVYPLNIGLRF
jgi:hypothetical protein